MWRKGEPILLHPKLLRLCLFFIVLILIGTLVYVQLEGWSLLDALYFTVATLTTVGYGDFVPTHDVSKIVTIVYMLMIVPMILLSISLAGEIIHDHLLKSKRGRKR
jgi:voltage-gated potassium channel